MLNTKSDLINSVKRVYPSMPNATADVMFDEVDREIRAQVHLTSDYESLTALVNGTKRYTMASNVMGVYTCRLQNSSTFDDFTELHETSIESVEQDDRSQLKRVGTPRVFAVDGAEIFVHPAPDFNSTNGYPRLIMRVDRATTLASNGALPADVPSYDAWKYGMCAKYGTDIGDERAKGHERAFAIALNKLSKWHHSKNRYTGPTVKPLPFFNNPRVR